MAKVKPESSAVEAAATTITANNVAVIPHALDQYQVMVDGVRVAYVCVGPDKPINFLPRGDSAKLWLTNAEKIAICKIVREKMATVTDAQDSEEAELARLIAGEPLPEAN